MNETTVQFSFVGARMVFGAHTVLDIDQLHIASHCTTCILGPTGAGKSTLLRLCCGTLRPTSGIIGWRDSQVGPSELRDADRRSIAAVFQHPILLRRSVLANVAYPLKLRGVGKEADSLALQTLGKLGIEALAHRSVRTLSGGQCQLVGVARALVAQPDVLLLDEPTSHLDPAAVATVERVVRNEQQARRCTVLWSTHNLLQAKRVADRVMLLIDGRVVEFADTRSFFQQPQNQQTRDFLDGRFVC